MDLSDAPGVKSLEFPARAMDDMTSISRSWSENMGRSGSMVECAKATRCPSSDSPGATYRGLVLGSFAYAALIHVVQSSNFKRHHTNLLLIETRTRFNVKTTYLGNLIHATQMPSIVEVIHFSSHFHQISDR